MLQPNIGLQFREQLVLVMTRTADDRAIQDVPHHSLLDKAATQGYRVLGLAKLGGRDNANSALANGEARAGRVIALLFHRNHRV
jgi:hypothetical protein